MRMERIKLVVSLAHPSVDIDLPIRAGKIFMRLKSVNGVLARESQVVSYGQWAFSEQLSNLERRSVGTQSRDTTGKA
jgi:hypothetical protein